MSAHTILPLAHTHITLIMSSTPVHATVHDDSDSDVEVDMAVELARASVKGHFKDPYLLMDTYLRLDDMGILPDVMAALRAFPAKLRDMTYDVCFQNTRYDALARMLKIEEEEKNRVLMRQLMANMKQKETSFDRVKRLIAVEVEKKKKGKKGKKTGKKAGRRSDTEADTGAGAGAGAGAGRKKARATATAPEEDEIEVDFET